MLLARASVVPIVSRLIIFRKHSTNLIRSTLIVRTPLCRRISELLICGNVDVLSGLCRTQSYHTNGEHPFKCSGAVAGLTRSRCDVSAKSEMIHSTHDLASVPGAEVQCCNNPTTHALHNPREP